MDMDPDLFTSSERQLLLSAGEVCDDHEEVSSDGSASRTFTVCSLNSSALLVIYLFFLFIFLI